jgi:hypothetical protein
MASNAMLPFTKLVTAALSRYGGKVFLPNPS